MPIEKNEPPYLCSACSFITDKKTDWKRHLETNKHKHFISLDTKTPRYVCELCNKQYTNKSSFYYHKTKCDKNPQDTVIEKTGVILANQGNKQIILSLLENNNKLIENNRHFYEENNKVFLSTQKTLLNLLKDM